MWLTAAAAAATASSVAFLAATAFFVLAACDQREREGWKKGGKVGAESLSGDGRMADEYRQLAINTPSTKLERVCHSLWLCWSSAHSLPFLRNLGTKTHPHTKTLMHANTQHTGTVFCEAFVACKVLAVFEAGSAVSAGSPAPPRARAAADVSPFRPAVTSLSGHQSVDSSSTDR